MFETLPAILKVEISQVPIKETTVDTKAKLASDIMRLLQVREHNEAMAKDWLLFFSTTAKYNQLRPGEVYNAHKMAMSRELYDSDEKPFNLLPELSINTSAKILEAYIKYKKNNPELIKAKDELLLLGSKKVTEEQKLEIREEFIRMLFEEMQNKEVAEDSWILYDELSKFISQSDEQKKNLYKQQEHIYLMELKQDVLKNNGNTYYSDILKIAQGKVEKGKYIAIVQNRCRSIMVSNYLKPYLKDFDSFRNAINKDKL